MRVATAITAQRCSQFHIVKIAVSRKNVMYHLILKTSKFVFHCDLDG